MVGGGLLISGALKCLPCCRAVVAICPSELRDVNVLVVNAFDGRVGPMQYLARWIDKERGLRMLLVPHLGHTSMVVPIPLRFLK